jgi:cyanate permease
MGGMGGLANWQWLFLLEGIPSIVVGLLALVIIVDRPGQARWLTQGERQLVLADLEADRREAGPREHGFGEALKLPQLWLVTIIYFCANSSNATIGFWIPSIIQGLGVKSRLSIGLLSAVPYIVAVISMALVSRHSDRTLERRYHSAIPMIVCALGLVGIGVFSMPALAFVALVLAVLGPLSGFPPFWEIPRGLLAGTAAAGGFALINSIGNLSGWIGPSVVGWFEDITGKTATGLYVVAGLEILGALMLLFVPSRAVATSGTVSK